MEQLLENLRGIENMSGKSAHGGEDTIETLVRGARHLASKEGEIGVSRDLQAPIAKLQKKYGPKEGEEARDYSAKEAREVGKTVVKDFWESVYGKVKMGFDDDYWAGRAQNLLGDNYGRFLGQIKDGNMSSAIELVRESLARERITNILTGKNQTLKDLDAKDRMKVGESLAGEYDLDPHTVSQDLSAFYTAARGVEQAKEAAAKPKKSPYYHASHQSHN